VRRRARYEILLSVLKLCGCELDDVDAAVLIGRLDDDPTLLSDEAAATLRYAIAADLPAETLDYDLRDVIRQALYWPLPDGIAALREALSRENQQCRLATTAQ
jgi:hypothetical protein